ncbi:MAG: nucleotidyltransferase family protein [Vicinamibacterales bacterium]
MIRFSRAQLLELLRLVPDAPDRFRDAIGTLAGERDAQVWDDLIASAGYHGVLSVLDWGLVPGAHVPPRIRAEAGRRLAVQQIWHAHLMHGLETAVTALGDAGVDACAVKGPALAERLYPTPSARHCLDLDLLVRQEDFDRAARALAECGYGTGRVESIEYLRRFGHHVDFSQPGRAPIELHFRAYAGFGVELPAGLLLDRASPCRLSDTCSVLTPSPEDELLYLATHAAGHSFIRLVWLYDLKLLVRRYPSLDWNAVGERAAAFGVTSPVAYALRLLEQWLGVSLPDLPRGLVRRSLRARVADSLLDEVSRPQPVSVRDNLGGLIFTSLLCDRVRSGAWLLQHHVLRSTRRRLRHAAPGLLPAHWSA